MGTRPNKKNKTFCRGKEEVSCHKKKMKEQRPINYELLARYFAGETTAAEEVWVEEWRLENQEEFDRLLLVWKDTGALPSIGLFDTEKALGSVWAKIEANKSAEVVEPKVPRKIVAKRNNWWRRIAALLVLGIALALVLHWTGYLERTTVLSTSMREKERVTLSDGTLVILNEKSTLTFPKSFEGKAERVVELKGEAFFDVADDAEHPFVILTKDTRIKVLGTTFTVREKEEEVLVTVASGKVLFSEKAETEKEGVLVLPQKQAVFSKKKQAIAAEKVANYNEMAWATKKLTFENVPLPLALADIERCYGLQFNLDNPKLANCRFTAQFDNKSYKTVIETLKLTFDLKMAYRDETYQLDGEGCE